EADAPPRKRLLLTTPRPGCEIGESSATRQPGPTIETRLLDTERRMMTALELVNRNGTDSHSSGTGVRGSERVTRECTYQDFMKCKPLNAFGCLALKILSHFILLSVMG
ncbi:hypothetical protein Tco_0141609, partial [Tanacetum coccineum]